MAAFANHDGMCGGVYLIRIGPRIYYVGMADDFRRRRNAHLCYLRRGDHYNDILQRSYNKHGEKGFYFDPIVFCSRETAAKVEAWLIQRHISDRNCANLRIEDGTTYTLSEETRRKMSEASRIENLSDERRRKLSASLLGKPKSEEHRRNIRASRLGKTHSAETRRRLSEAHTRRPPASEETRRKISESNRNRSAETRRKLSEATKRYWAAKRASAQLVEEA